MPNGILMDWADTDKLNAASVEAEILFVRLLMKAKDDGRYDANPQLVNAFFPKPKSSY
jgi:hypothetical protein